MHFLFATAGGGRMELVKQREMGRSMRIHCSRPKKKSVRGTKASAKSRENLN